MKTSSTFTARFSSVIAAIALMICTANMSQAQQKLVINQGIQGQSISASVKGATATIKTPDYGNTGSQFDPALVLKADFNMAVRGQKVAFDNLSSGPIETIVWEFTHCEPQINVVNPIQEFPGPGNYTVTLLIIGKEGKIAKSVKEVSIR